MLSFLSGVGLLGANLLGVGRDLHPDDLVRPHDDAVAAAAATAVAPVAVEPGQGLRVAGEAALDGRDHVRPEAGLVHAARHRAQVAAGSVADWSRESWQVAHDSVYASAIPGGDACAATPAKVTLDAATIDRLVPVARLEVERGGLRLAKLLDEALG